MPLPEETASDPGLMKEQRRIAVLLEAIRQFQALGPTPPDPSLSEQELARRLIYDILGALTRAELLLTISGEAVQAYTEEMQRSNDLKQAEVLVQQQLLELQRAKNQREEEQDNRRWAVVSRTVGSVSSWFGVVLFDQRVVTAVVTFIGTILTGILASWGLGVHLGL